jgi:hypothetical protein
MLKMKITINSFPSHKLYSLDVYSGVEVILEVREGEWQAPLRKDPTILILCPQIRQIYGGEFKQKILVLLMIEPLSSSPMASHVVLTRPSQFIGAYIVRTTQLNGEKWAEYVALMKINECTQNCGPNRRGRKGNRETQKIILKWIFESCRFP